MLVSHACIAGWLEYGPIPDWREPLAAPTDWSFYGASVEQGLLYYYYFCHLDATKSMLESSHTWDDRFTHFTGASPAVSTVCSELCRLQQAFPPQGS